MPLPAARRRSPREPWGQSSMAISPVRYFFSRILLLPRYDRMSRSTCPSLVRMLSPPLPSTPALLDTAVRECSDWGPRRCRAVMRVSATPQRPKPEERRVMPEGMSATAASALSQSLEAPRSGAGAGRLGAERRWWVVVKRRGEGNVLLPVRPRLGLGFVVVLREVDARLRTAAVGRVVVWVRERREGMERRRCREVVAMVDVRFLGGKRERERGTEGEDKD